jgi:sugar lactone lactonase YvrE
VATTAAGTTVWVVDMNKTIYVYNNGGVILGSWTAGGLNPQAQIEGIATNGTDVWLVDAKQDKVYKYAGAAIRLTGNQNASSSFNLNSADSNPKDIVTDGAGLWVVDDGTSTDKVFKYALNGSLLGSWSIDPANKHPTGITINPANVSDIWVVDSGTLRVYQYAGAASRISGSQSAAATFALNPFDTNPQGIADPPAISIGDATAVEGGSAPKALDRFIPEGSGGLSMPIRQSVFGPDGNNDGVPDLYVASAGSNAILRYDGLSGSFIDTFIPPGTGGLNGPVDLAFGPDGNLYVSSLGNNPASPPSPGQVIRYNSSGAFLGVVANNLSTPVGITFGADGSLYIANQGTNEVLRYHNSTLSVFVTAGSGGLGAPRKPEFGPDGNGDGVPDLYVASSTTSSVLRYDGLTGAFIDTFAAPVPGQVPLFWMAFGTDGYLYTTVAAGPDVKLNRFNGTTGAYVDTLTMPLGGPSIMAGPESIIYRSSNGEGNFVERYGPSSLAAFTVSLDTASPAPVTVHYSTANGTALAASDYLASSGTVTFAPGETSHTILIRTIDDALSEPTETFFVSLSSPLGATVARGQAVGTILDNDPLQVSSAKVNGGAVQRSRVTDIAIAFTGLATLPANPADAFRLTRLNPDGSTADVTLAVDPSASTATQTIARLTFTGGLTEFGSLADGRYRLTILAAQVSGNGQPLDGDANGSAGGDFVMNLFRLYGDVNGDGAVNGLDLTAFRNAFGTVSTDTNFMSFLDFNGDGTINGTDMTQFRSRFGVILP